MFYRNFLTLNVLKTPLFLVYLKSCLTKTEVANSSLVSTHFFTYVVLT